METAVNGLTIIGEVSTFSEENFSRSAGGGAFSPAVASGPVQMAGKTRIHPDPMPGGAGHIEPPPPLEF
jgi:hypothetical protein